MNTSKGIALAATAIAALVFGMSLEGHYDRDPAPTPAVTVAPAVVDSDCWDDFSCAMTHMGWVQVTQELGDAFAEGDDQAPENATTRDWESCFYKEGDTTFILCPDGYITSS